MTITENGTTQVLPDDGNDGMTAVNVTVDVPTSGGGGGFKTYTTTSTGQTNGLIIEGVDLVEAKMFIVEFKSQSTESPQETGYTTYGGLIVWLGGMVDDLAMANSMRTIETTHGGTAYSRNVAEMDMFGLINSSYFNAGTFSGNFKVQRTERTAEKTTIYTACPINANTVFDVVVHYM